MIVSFNLFSMSDFITKTDMLLSKLSSLYHLMLRQQYAVKVKIQHICMCVRSDFFNNETKKTELLSCYFLKLKPVHRLII